MGRDVITSNYLSIGFVGYSDTKFDLNRGREYVEDAFRDIKRHYELDSLSDQTIEVVSGWTKQGIPKLVYDFCDEYDIETVGFTSFEALKYKTCAVDRVILVGEKFGDESAAFVNYINCLVRVGGGKQSRKEIELFREFKPNGLVIEYEL